MVIFLKARNTKSVMKKINSYFFCVVLIVAISSCKKPTTDNAVHPDATELLTASPWTLLSYGYDDNRNGIVDGSEEAIQDCEKDNTYIFNKDGSGVARENTKICDGNEPTHSFTWALTNNNTKLDFLFGQAYLVNLSPSRLVISNSNSDPLKLLVIYGR